jgi:hypothetical protein
MLLEIKNLLSNLWLVESFKTFVDNTARSGHLQVLDTYLSVRLR